MTLEIRDASAEDAELVAWVEIAAARSHRPLGLFDVMFPGPDTPRLELVADIVRAAGAPSFAHYGGFLVAELDGVPVGALSGYAPLEKPIGRFVAATNDVLGQRGWSPPHIELLWQRLAPTVECMSDSPDDRWVVEFVALRPEARGKGIAARLLDRILARGREQGFAGAQISYLIGNDPARLTYERAGFAAVDEKRGDAFERIFGSPGTVRMWMDL